MMQEQLAPNWRDHLQSIPVGKAQLPYAGGTPTMDWHNMQAENQRNAARIASQEMMHAKDHALALRKQEFYEWYERENLRLQALERAAYDAAMAQYSDRMAFESAKTTPTPTQGNITTEKPLPPLATKPGAVSSPDAVLGYHTNPNINMINPRTGLTVPAVNVKQFPGQTQDFRKYFRKYF